MNLEGSIDAWIQETKDMLLEITTLIEKTEAAKKYHNMMVIPESLRAKALNDIDFAGLQIDKAITELSFIKGKLEKRIQQLENEKREAQAHEIKVSSDMDQERKFCFRDMEPPHKVVCVMAMNWNQAWSRIAEREFNGILMDAQSVLEETGPDARSGPMSFASKQEALRYMEGPERRRKLR